jgi:hypothetical protein
MVAGEPSRRACLRRFEFRTASLARRHRALDWDQSNALPSSARAMLSAEPLWVDLSSVETPSLVDRSNPVLRDSVAQIAAPLRRVDRDELSGIRMDVTAVAFSPDGRTLVTGSLDHWQRGVSTALVHSASPLKRLSGSSGRQEAWYPRRRATRRQLCLSPPCGMPHAPVRVPKCRGG